MFADDRAEVVKHTRLAAASDSSNPCCVRAGMRLAAGTIAVGVVVVCMVTPIVLS